MYQSYRSHKCKCSEVGKNDYAIYKYKHKRTQYTNKGVFKCSLSCFWQLHFFYQISGFFIALLEQMRLTNLMILTDKQYIVWVFIENQTYWYVHRDKCIVFLMISLFITILCKLIFMHFLRDFFLDKTNSNVFIT